MYVCHPHETSTSGNLTVGKEHAFKNEPGLIICLTAYLPASFRGF